MKFTRFQGLLLFILILISGVCQNTIANNYPQATDHNQTGMQEVNYFTGLLNLIGNTKSEVLTTVGQQPESSVQNGDTEILHYPGIDLHFTKEVLDEIWFSANPESGSFEYTHNVFAGIGFNGNIQSMKFTIELVQRFIGPYESMEESTYVEAVTFENKTKYYYYWLDKNLILTFEGSVKSMVVKGRQAANLIIESQQNASNVANLVYLLNDKLSLLNKPEKKLEELVGPPEVSPQVNGDSKEYYYLSGGFALTYNLPNEVFSSIILLPKDENFNQYAHELPFDLSWQISPSLAISKLGDPTDTQINSGFNIQIFEDRGLALYFDENTGTLVRIQLFVASKPLLVDNY